MKNAVLLVLCGSQSVNKYSQRDNYQYSKRFGKPQEFNVLGVLLYLKSEELVVVKKNLLCQNKTEIDRLEKEIQKERKRLLSESQVDRNLIQESINDIKQRLEYLIEKENILKQCKKTNIDLEKAKERKKLYLKV